MQAPSGAIPLELVPSDDESMSSQVGSGESLQKFVHFDLKEEGNHELAVSLSYSETTISKERSASSGRVRTFRKLYKFVSQPCLSVRTKVSDFPSAMGAGKAQPQNTTSFALEAQLENMADGSIALEQVSFNPQPPFRSTSLNWDFEGSDEKNSDMPMLVPRDVVQVAFLIETDPEADDPTQQESKDGRTILGQLSIQWRTPHGDKGSLNTGWLMTKRR